MGSSDLDPSAGQGIPEVFHQSHPLLLGGYLLFACTQRRSGGHYSYTYRQTYIHTEGETDKRRQKNKHITEKDKIKKYIKTNNILNNKEFTHHL